MQRLESIPGIHFRTRGFHSRQVRKYFNQSAGSCKEFINKNDSWISFDFCRDAKWEVEDSGPNAFYDFEQVGWWTIDKMFNIKLSGFWFQHSERPSECEAKECKCKRGRKYQVDIEHHRHSLEFCDYCGSHAAHLGCIKGDKYVCEECTVIAAKVESARIASFATQSTSSGISTLGRLGPQSPTFKILAAKYKLRECSVRLPRLTQRELDFALERGNCDYTAASTSTRCSMSSVSTVNIQTYTSSSDESKIQPCATHKNRKLSKILLSESDSDEDVAPCKKVRLSSTNSVTSSDMEQLKLKFDINDNSKDVPSSNIAPEICRIQTQNRTNISLMSAFNPIPNGIYRDNQPSSSEEEQIKPTGLISGKSLAFESSDDQVFGNENEKPGKNVAVVRPFSRNDTSSDSSSIIKPAKIKPRPRKLLSSSDEPFDDFPEAISSPKRDHAATNMETGIKRSIDGTSSVACIKVRLSPSKRKHRSVLSYFRDTTSSSDEEVVEPKSKKKSPKIKSRSPASTIPSNQATIMQFFKKHVSSNI